MASWVITKDIICDGKYNGEFGGDKKYVLDEKCKNEFRLFDDDGELYFEGKSGNSSSFDPLDDFGMPGFGCTYIEYKNKDTGKWEVL